MMRVMMLPDRLAREELDFATGFLAGLDPSLVLLRRIAVPIARLVLAARQVNLEGVEPIIARAKSARCGHVSHGVSAPPHGAGVGVGAMDQLCVVQRTLVRL